MRQLHLRTIPDGHKDAVHGHHLSFSGKVIEKFHFLDLIRTLDLPNLGIEEDRYLGGQEAVFQLGLRPQGITPVGQRYLDPYLVQVEGLFGNGAVSPAHHEDLPFLE